MFNILSAAKACANCIAASPSMTQWVLRISVAASTIRSGNSTLAKRAVSNRLNTRRITVGDAAIQSFAARPHARDPDNLCGQHYNKRLSAKKAAT